METKKYLTLIDQELNNLPVFIREYNLSTNHSLTTSYQYLTEIRRFFDWLRHQSLSPANSNVEISINDLKQLTRSDMMIYIDALRHSKNQQGRLNSPTTVNRSINALRSLFTFLTITADKPYFDHNIMLKIQSLNNLEILNYRAHVLESHMYTGNLKYEFLDFLSNKYASLCNKQALASFKLNKERDIAIIALILGTGVRVSECSSINISDLNLKEATLDLTRKGGQKDSIPVASWTLPYISAYAEVRTKRYHAEKNDKAFFLTYYHKKTSRITPNGIERLVSKYSKAFGHPLTPHKLRHTLASELYGVTKDQVLVAQQLGQKGTTATDLYTHVDQKEQRKALDQLADNHDN